MRVVIDTNVFISAVFFKGKPGVILDGFRAGQLEMILSAEILKEYSDVLERLSAKFPSVDASGILSIVAAGCTTVMPGVINDQVCADPDDDKFLRAALGGNSKTIVSGDKHLLDVNGYAGIEILGPAEFVERCLTERSSTSEQHENQGL